MKIFKCKVCGHLLLNETLAKCPVCGNEEFVQNDNLFKESEEKSKEAAIKHVPSVQVNKKCGLIPEGACTDIIVRIGKTLHPMEEKHFIVFIDCYVDEKHFARSWLTPNVQPAACFHLKKPGAKVTIVENCNIHGYWMTEASLT